MRLAQYVLVLGVTGSAGCVRYRPSPLDPTSLARVYDARQLSDRGLRHFLTSAGIRPQDQRWRPRELSLVALYFHPELDVARAGWQEALATEVTAGARPQPSADVGVAHVARPDEGKTTPWSVSLGAGMTLETGGKRGARLARARAGTAAARLQLEATAWRIAGDAADAGISALTADRNLDNAEAEEATLGRVLALLRARYAQGAASLTEVARAQGDLQAATVAVLSAQRERAASRAQLARTVGLPVARVDSLSLTSDPASGCTLLDSVPTAVFERRALQTRADVGVELATYAQAEGDLRVAVAEQYPDLALAPGIGWEQGIGRWSLGLGLPRIVLNRNRGPIAEAAARRAATAARFDEVQQQTLREVAAAAAECRGARIEAAQADMLVGNATRRLALAQAAYERGETGETEVAFAELDLVRARHVRNLAGGRLASADLGFDRAVGTWVGTGAPHWPDVTQPPRSAPTLP